MSSTMSHTQSANFLELANSQPDLQDFMTYLSPTLERLNFMSTKIQAFSTEASKLPANRQLVREVDKLLNVELKGLVENYCALELKWRNTQIIKTENGRDFTAKDVLLENLEQISAIVEQTHNEFQHTNRQEILTQNRYLMQKSAGLQTGNKFDNLFDYNQHKETSNEVEVAALFEKMTQAKQAITPVKQPADIQAKSAKHGNRIELFMATFFFGLITLPFIYVMTNYESAQQKNFEAFQRANTQKLVEQANEYNERDRLMTSAAIIAASKMALEIDTMKVNEAKQQLDKAISQRDILVAQAHAQKTAEQVEKDMLRVIKNAENTLNQQRTVSK